MQILYNIAAVLLVVLILPVFVVRSFRERGFTERIKQSFGFLPDEALAPVARKNCIWVHAASVGEIVAASPLIKEFRREFPERPILVSVVTSSGYEMANRIVKDADSIIYFPLDLPFLSEYVVQRVLPSIFLPVETELWPNFLKAARRHRIPVMMVNGRISDKSVKRYHHLRGLLKDMIGTVNKFCMQSPIDARYIVQLGANPALVTVTGNTKFDQTYTCTSAEEKRALLEEMRLSEAEGVFLAGSTHKGEEAYVLDAYEAVRREFPAVRLVIAPRDIQRAGEIAGLAERRGLTAAMRTTLQQGAASPSDVVILDTIGELGKVYSVGDVIYVGGSLVPHGGHNILEPAAHGKAIVVGPNMFNFKDTHALFAKRAACVTVENGKALADAVLRLFRDGKARKAMEDETLAIVEENRGAAKRSAVLLRELLDALEAEKDRFTVAVESFQTYPYRLVHDETSGFLSSAVRAVLYVFSLLYRQLVNLKLALYHVGVFKQYALDCYVISLGNITVGGTGKTPTAQKLAGWIRDRGYRVAILNRGYRAKWRGDVGVVSDGEKVHMSAAEAGDEAFLLAKNLPGVPVLIGADRALTGRYAVEQFGAQVVVLDDGYQHWRLRRDLDILLVDAINVFGNKHMLPRGTLREPLSHLSRAGVCLLTKVDQAGPEACDRIKETVSRYNADVLFVESIHGPQAFIEIGDWYAGAGDQGVALEALRGKKVMAVSAIGNPASFEQTLSGSGAVVTKSIRFPDHHDYTTAEMQMVLDKSIGDGVEAIVITDKDAVKIPVEIIRSPRPLPVYILRIEIHFQAGYGDLAARIERELQRKGKGKA